jgi:high-affinity Fe2+/Pb2+ permease
MANGDGEGTASNAIWAVALVIIVALIVGVVYYSGVLRSGGQKKEIDINVSAPSR